MRGRLKIESENRSDAGCRITVRRRPRRGDDAEIAYNAATHTHCHGLTRPGHPDNEGTLLPDRDHWDKPGDDNL